MKYITQKFTLSTRGFQRLADSPRDGSVRLHKDHGAAISASALLSEAQYENNLIM